MISTATVVKFYFWLYFSIFCSFVGMRKSTPLHGLLHPVFLLIKEFIFDPFKKKKKEAVYIWFTFIISRCFEECNNAIN